MNTALLSRSPAHNLLAMAGLGVLTATLGCQLGEADVVRRAPAVVSSTGGSGGSDAVFGVDAIAMDAAIRDLPASDSWSATSDVSTTGEGAMTTAATDIGSSTDVPDVLDGRDQAANDSVNIPVYDGGGGEVSTPCGGDGYEFCDGFDDGAPLWTETVGEWSTIPENGAPDANAIFGPTTAVSSIAYVPSGAWQDMTVEARVMVTSFGQYASSNRVILYARYQDLSHFYAVALRGDGKLSLRRNAATFGTLASVNVAENEWHTLKIRVAGAADNVAVEGYLDGALLTAATDTSGSLNGDIGTIAVGVYGGAMAVFDDIKVSSP